ncbi:fungal-specific transcription factor domain-containing protein [Bisporella sp. PMI_857]|nr:fungal-specific transcription factor domain-containing protein [Bisporella sp. PMI_857]
MPIAEKSACVRHATLSLAASYVLDYKRNELLEKRANFHHKKAVLLLDKELKDRHNFLPGKEEALIAALIIITHTEEKPKWHLATRLAERILDYSDPAYNYQSPNNVQFSRARPELANIICLDNVLSDCVFPLDPHNSKCRYPWLLRGNPREQRRIISFTGFSSLLMHYFVKITHLSARRQKYPNSDIIPTVGSAIEEVLSEFRQWSGLSEGCEGAEALFDSCELVDGKVTTREKVTELIAESYVAAAQIYLHCRLFRRRRNDKIVQAFVHDLLRNIDMQPTSGPLFTAQTPLFSIFIAGIAASQPKHRDIIRNWFIPVCTDSRGNVPPTWDAMQRIWEWVDEYDLAHPYNKDTGSDPPAISQDNSDAWWEELVEKIRVDYGRMNLA